MQTLYGFWSLPGTQVCQIRQKVFQQIVHVVHVLHSNQSAHQNISFETGPFTSLSRQCSREELLMRVRQKENIDANSHIWPRMIWLIQNKSLTVSCSYVHPYHPKLLSTSCQRTWRRTLQRHSDQASSSIICQHLRSVRFPVLNWIQGFTCP